MRFNTKHKRSLAVVLLLAIAVLFSGGLLTTIQNEIETDPPPQELDYTVIITGTRVDGGMTCWGWTGRGDTLTLNAVSPYIGTSYGDPLSKENFMSATVKGTLIFYIASPDITGGRVHYENANVNIDGQSGTIEGSLRDAPLTNYRVVWDTTTVDNGVYNVVLEGDFNGVGTNVLSFIFTQDADGGVISAVNTLMWVVIISGVGLAAFLLIRGKRNTR